MSLTNFNKDLHNGPNTNFLLATPGFKLLPAYYSFSTSTIDDELNNPILKILFNIYINYDNFFGLSISYEKINNKLNAVAINISHEVFYEYGNEEHRLPNHKNYSIFNDESELLNHIKNQINKIEFTYKPVFFDNLYDNFLFSFNKLKEEINNTETNKKDIDYINLHSFFNYLNH